MKTITLKKTALALAALSLVAAGAAVAQDANPFLGAWKGTLSIAGVELEIGINFKLDEAKAVQGTFDSITQGAMGIPLGRIVIEGKSISFIIDHPGVPGEPSFKGTLDETGKQLVGDFTQSGYAGTFAVGKE